MSQPCEQPPGPGLEADLVEIDDLLRAVVADGFTVYLCGGARHPEAIVATYAWADHIDFVVIRDLNDVAAARARQTEDFDVFAPETVVWSYQGHARWTLRAALDLVPPEHADAPDEEYPAPETLRLPGAYLRSVSVRSPRPGLVARRAMRLRMAHAC